MDDGTDDYELPSHSVDDYANRSQQCFNTSLCMLPDHATDLTQPDQETQSLPDECDFLTLVSAISTAYSSGRYMPMLALNDFRWTNVAGGKDFQVSRTKIYISRADDQEPLRGDVSGDKPRRGIIIKRLQSARSDSALQPKDMALFVRELSILHHLSSHEGIVQLLGVGWFYDGLEDANLTPAPKPALLMEEAAGTLNWLLKRQKEMALVAEMKICSDIASGLLALHKCGLMHGDVKPDNVLVFRRPFIEEGAEVFRYRCKISDFSLARVVGTKESWYSGGTRLYMAPELGTLSAERMFLTDVWSLGILFAEVTQRGLDLKPGAGKPELMERLINRSAQESMQSGTWDPAMKALRLSLFKNTVRQTPEDRSLENVVLDLENYFEKEARQWVSAPTHTDTTTFQPVNCESILISYENFKYTSGEVHDTIAAKLQEVASNEDDPRQAKACFELAVIALSSFNGPIFTPQDGLDWLWKAADRKDIRAQGVFYRIQKALDQHATVSSQVLDWLENAAKLGHTVAVQDLQHLDEKRFKKSQLENPDQLLIQAKLEEISNLLPSTSPSKLSLLDNDPLTVTDIAKETVRLEATLKTRDEHGNTLLLLASRFSTLKNVVKLLDSGADPTATNNADENFLHYAWRFSKTELQEIIWRVQDYPSILLQEAKGVRMDEFLELYPLPHGTPLERAVAMNNPQAVRILLHAGKHFMLVNGREVRRALLVAFRLNLVKIQHIIIHFVRVHSQLWEPDLPDLLKTSWEHKRRKRSFLDAVLLGGVSGFGLGADVPLKWWRLCQLGHDHTAALNGSIQLVLSLATDESGREKILNSSFLFIFGEKFHDSTRVLLEWKAKITEGITRRSPTLRHLTWDEVSIPQSRKGQAYRRLLLLLPRLSRISRGPWTQRAQSFARYHPSRLEIFEGSVSKEHRKSTTPRSWQTLQSASKNGILERPMVTVNYVDQIFYNERKGTLMQQAIRSGDRTMFSVLVHDFGASLAHPAPAVDDGSQMNVYRILTYTPHCDLWFAKQFLKMKVGFSFPFEDTPWTDETYKPPLYEALIRRRWRYAMWMLRHGAKLEQKTKPRWTVLSSCMVDEKLDLDLFDFLFPPGGHGRGSIYMPQELRVGTGFETFEFVFDCHRQEDCSDHGFLQRFQNRVWPLAGSPTHQFLTEYNYYFYRWTDGLQAEDELYSRINNVASLVPCPPKDYYERKVIRKRGLRLQQIWEHLFDIYPQLSNSPTQRGHFRLSIPIPTLKSRSSFHFTYRWLSFNAGYPVKPTSIFEQSLSLRVPDFALFRIALERFEKRAALRSDEDAFPMQTWLDLLFGSPVDNISLASWRNNPLSVSYGYWPSIHHWLPRVVRDALIFVFFSAWIQYITPVVLIETVLPNIFRFGAPIDLGVMGFITFFTLGLCGVIVVLVGMPVLLVFLFGNTINVVFDIFYFRKRILTALLVAWVFMMAIAMFLGCKKSEIGTRLSSSFNE